MSSIPRVFASGYHAATDVTTPSRSIDKIKRSDTKLFRVGQVDVEEVPGQCVAVEKSLQSLLEKLQGRFEVLKAFLMSLGDDVQMKQLKNYVAFRRLKNFVCAHPQNGQILLYVKGDLSAITLESEFTRDVSNIGHFGTGNLEIRVRSGADIEKAKPLILSSYEASSRFSSNLGSPGTAILPSGTASRFRRG